MEQGLGWLRLCCCHCCWWIGSSTEALFVEKCLGFPIRSLLGFYFPSPLVRKSRSVFSFFLPLFFLILSCYRSFFLPLFLPFFFYACWSFLVAVLSIAQSKVYGRWKENPGNLPCCYSSNPALSSQYTFFFQISDFSYCCLWNNFQGI